MKPTVFIIWMLVFCASSQAQVLDGLLVKADSLYQTTGQTLVFEDTSSSQKFPFEFYQESPTHANHFEIRLKELEATEYQKDWGLVFKANSNYNFRDAFDQEFNTFNRLNLRAEVEWNILKNGFTYNRTKAQQKLNEARHLKLQDQQLKKQVWRRQFRTDYQYIANKEAIELFESFLTFENNYFDFLNTLYVQKLIKRERLITVSNQIHILQNQLEVLKKENELLQDSISSTTSFLQKLPLFTIRTDSISMANSIYNTPYLQENIELEHKPVNNFSLSVYVNQNFNYSFTRNQVFASVGFRFRAPLRLNKRKQIIKTKLQLLAAREKDRSAGAYSNLITYINTYNEKLKDLQNQYKNWKVISERIRILKVLKSELSSYDTGLLILELAEEQFAILENMIQLKRQLYNTIAHLFEQYPSQRLQDMLVPYVFTEEKNKPLVLLTKSNQYSLDFQYDFLQAGNHFTIAVREDHLQIQQYLTGKKIPFTLVQKGNENMRVEDLIHEELKKIVP
ncbi:hypothetical protein [Ascidiimonas aurantiaca]|uniref:hypothetical protein n=1 Tax=Ascidiimonas aurantiaca TaxID=1685432 RepID=UPI0030EE6FDD